MKICKFINKDPFIELDNDIKIPLQSNNNCEAKNGIYFIKCKLCNTFYIDETKDIKRRIGYQIGIIKNFIPFKKYHDLPVAKHFNLKNHNFNTCFEFSIFKDKIENNNNRFNIEKECIYFRGVSVLGFFSTSPVPVPVLIFVYQYQLYWQYW